MVSVKQMAIERVRSAQENSLNGLLTPAGLRAIGIILEEFMMDRVQTLRNTSTAPSSVTDDLRACIEKSEAETSETNQDKIVLETDEKSSQHATFERASHHMRGNFGYFRTGCRNSNILQVFLVLLPQLTLWKETGYGSMMKKSLYPP